MRQIAHALNSALRAPIVALGALALVACGSASAAVIPAEFQGNWHEGGDAIPVCTPGDVGIVQVAAGEFTYPMAGNTVLAVEPVDLNVIRVTFRHQGFGDGATEAPRTVTEKWTLSHDEEYLLIEGGKGGPVNGVADLFRCVKAASAN